jgi:hypothetical protein
MLGRCRWSHVASILDGRCLASSIFKLWDALCIWGHPVVHASSALRVATATHLLFFSSSSVQLLLALIYRRVPNVKGSRRAARAPLQICYVVALFIAWTWTCLSYAMGRSNDEVPKKSGLVDRSNTKFKLPLPAAAPRSATASGGGRGRRNGRNDWRDNESSRDSSPVSRCRARSNKVTYTRSPT